MTKGKGAGASSPPIPQPAWAVQVLRIFQDEVKSGPVPSLEQLAALSRLVELALTKESTATEEPHVTRGKELWAEFRVTAYKARNALLTLRSTIPPEDWAKLCSRNPGLAQVADAFAEFGDCLYPDREPEPRQRGRQRDLEGQFDAWAVAELVRDALRDAGRNNVSITSPNGPVARIGAKIFALAMGQGVLSPATFVSRVNASLVKKSRKKADLLPSD